MARLYTALAEPRARPAKARRRGVKGTAGKTPDIVRNPATGRLSLAMLLARIPALSRGPIRTGTIKHAACVGDFCPPGAGPDAGGGAAGARFLRRSGRQAAAHGGQYRHHPDLEGAAAEQPCPICRPARRWRICSRISWGPSRTQPRHVTSLGSGFIIDPSGYHRHQQPCDRGQRPDHRHAA